MRRFILPVVLAASLGLSACATNGSFTPVLNQITAQLIASVESWLYGNCNGLVVDAADIANVWNTTAGATVQAVGGALCSLVPRPGEVRRLPLKGTGPGAIIGTINGYVIHGYRAR